MVDVIALLGILTRQETATLKIAQVGEGLSETAHSVMLLLIGQNISKYINFHSKIKLFFQLMDTGVCGQVGRSAPKHVQLAPDTDPGNVLGHSVVENHARETLIRRKTAIKKLFVVNIN